jgi:hypothetical protein
MTDIGHDHVAEEDLWSSPRNVTMRKSPLAPPLSKWGIRNGHERAGEIPARDRRKDGEEQMDSR